MQPLILASGSPRRRELLDQIGVRFTVQPANIDETPQPGELPQAYVLRMAREKAQVIANHCDSAAVLAADTSVVCNNQILGKPNSADEAKAMLQRLSGEQHQVLTSICIIPAEADRSLNVESSVNADHPVCAQVVSTDVTFRSLTTAEIDEYVATGEPMDKAGSYGIQGMGAVLVAGIHGSYSNVVGLPLTETAELLKRYGIGIWRS